MIRTDWASKEKLTATDLNDAFKGIKGAVAGSELFQYNETPLAATGFPGTFETAFPYKPNALSVYLGNGVDSEGLLLQVKDLHYTEDSDTEFTFINGAGVGATDPDASGFRIRINYMRSDL